MVLKLGSEGDLNVLFLENVSFFLVRAKRDDNKMLSILRGFFAHKIVLNFNVLLFVAES